MRKILASLVALLILMSLTACGGGEAIEGPDTPSSDAEGVEMTLPLPAPVDPQDRIRLAARRERDLNPLYPKHYSSEAILALVYQPLFSYSQDGKIEPVLADSFRWSQDGLALTVSIREGRTFHDGFPLLAEDVATSFRVYRSVLLASRPRTREDAEEGEVMEELDREDLFSRDGIFQARAYSLTHQARLDALENIRGVEVVSERRLIFHLNSPDPYLVGLLSFPVLPRTLAGTRSMNPAPGTGPWILKLEGEGHYSLLARDRGPGLNRIEIKTYSGIKEAVAAFDRQEIDLLLMDAQETLLYADRSRIRKQIFEEGGFIALFVRGNRDKALVKRDRLLYALQEDPAFDLIGAPLRQASYPILPGDFRLGGKRIPQIRPSSNFTGDEGGREGQDEAGRPETSGRPPFRLLIPQSFMPARLLDRLGFGLQAMDLDLVVSRAQADLWRAALASGAYDGVLLVEEGTAYPDPAAYLDALAGAGLFDWTDLVDSEDRALLMEGRRLTMSMERADRDFQDAYGEALARVFNRLPLIGLAATETMVWYSMGVEGTLRGDGLSPYLGVEDLLVWKP